LIKVEVKGNNINYSVNIVAWVLAILYLHYVTYWLASCHISQHGSQWVVS